MRSWSQDRLLNLIFEPGFSTRTETTDVSGRGVGMDVVRVIANRLGGSVSVTSEPSRGTTVLLDLPLSLALTRVVLVSVNGEVLAIPTAPIRRILRVPHAGRANAAVGRDRHRRRRRNHSARAAGARAGTARARRQRSNRRSSSRRADRALRVSVDAVLEEQELVFQELRGPLQHQPTISGAAILGNGEIVPILDVQALVERALQRPEPAPAAAREPGARRHHQRPDSGGRRFARGRASC